MNYLIPAGTGDLRDIGAGKGKYYAVNIPLRDGMDDESYESIFVPIISKVMETFQPSAVVLQCGADSLTGDRLGCFNLTVRGHGKCVEFVKKYGLPFMMVNIFKITKHITVIRNPTRSVEAVIP